MTAQNDMKQTALITYRDLAAWISLPLGTLYSLVAKKRIPHVRLGRRIVRFDRAEITSWLTEKSSEVRHGGE